MADKNGFYWRRETENQVDFVVLGARGARHELEAWIAPAIGANLCRFVVDGRDVIGYDPEVLRSGGFTGTPVLYPTPNRVRGGVFTYKGAQYHQIKRGRRVTEHGLVYEEPWAFGEPVVSADAVSFAAWQDFCEGSALFAAFPFDHRMTLRFALYGDGVEVTYAIENRGGDALPFGFGLHPYFIKLGGESKTYVKMPARYVMKNTPDLLPTGELEAVEGTVYDLGEPKSIGSVGLDDVFTGIPGAGPANAVYGGDNARGGDNAGGGEPEGAEPAGAKPAGGGAHVDAGGDNADGDVSGVSFAEVEYKNLGYKIVLKATADFTHLIVYVPAGEEFFCVENQTCSTDAHNMYDKGFEVESGLKFVCAGHTHSGSVKYAVEDTKDMA